MSFSEFDLIGKYSRPLTEGQPGTFGLKDDAAFLPSENGFIVTTDMLVGGVHFFEDADPALIAKKALRTNLSDLAAMGSVPVAYTISLCLPRKYMADESWIASFSAALKEENTFFNIYVLGGDTTSSDGPLTISITAFGKPSENILNRHRAQPGDLVFVTGTIGDAYLGLEVLQGNVMPEKDDAEYLVRRYWLPTPRVDIAPALAEIAHAAADVSDGLLADLGHICHASSLGAEIYHHKLPTSSAAKALVRKYPELYQKLFTNGDDYELVFTIAPEHRQACLTLSQNNNIKLTEIGQITSDVDLRVLDEDNQDVTFGALGYDHFK